MNRAELQLLATERLKDAESLLAGRRWAFAYYTAGYAVECALKSCVLARMIETGAVFRDKIVIAGKERKWDASDFRTHKFGELIDLAGLRSELEALQKADVIFAGNWSTAGRWTSDSRYETRSEADARELIGGITQPTHGVLEWLQKYW